MTHATKRPLRAACLSIALALGLGAAAAPLRAAGGWRYASSDHFEVYTTGDDARAREALRDFERVHAFFEAFLALPPAHGLPTRLIVFSSQNEYAPVRPNDVAAAFYQSGIDRDAIVMSSLDGDAFPVVVHEYAHLMIRRTGAVYPVWLNEGLAEFFSTIAPVGTQMRLGVAPEHRLSALTTGEPLMPLDRLFAIDHDSAEYNTASHAGLFYAESWAITHMLLRDEQYRARSATFLALMSKGAPAVEAWTSVYGKSLATVTRDLEHYIGRGLFGSVLADYSLVQDSRVSVRPASTFEAGVVMATLLGGMESREQEARGRFETLALQNPNDVLLLESRGLFELHRGHTTDALPYLAHAVELGSRNPRVYRDYAAAISTSDEPREEALLTTAAALDPDDVDVRADIARMRARRQRGPEMIDAAPEVVGLEKVVEGRIRNVVCGDSLVLEVATADGVLRVVIDDPHGVKIAGARAATSPLECGPQDRPVRVGYLPVADAARKIAGTVRFVEFR